MQKDEHEGLTNESPTKLATVASIRNAIPASTRPEEYSDPVATDVRYAWEKVRVGIEDILGQNPQLTFRPEDVYSELVAGRAVLFMSPVGWMVLSVEVDQFTADRTLLIWLAYTYDVGANNWVMHEEWLNDIAAGEDCSFIEARSAVTQMESYATSVGWTLDTRVFRKEVIEDGF
tara:strand:- start:198 stop:722 length:525 start_codon:yes stop_codon:yes gene_type:complete